MGQVLGLNFCCTPRREPFNVPASTASAGTIPAAAASEDAAVGTSTAADVAAAVSADVLDNLLQQQPRLVMDFEQEDCYACSTRFDMLVRRHHCRRCRNIYCHQCSSRSDRLLLYGVSKPVRLCDGCAEEAPGENHFVERHIPLLLQGATLKRATQHPLSLLPTRPRGRAVRLRVTPDLSTLEEIDQEEQFSRGQGGRNDECSGGGGSGIAAASVPRGAAAAAKKGKTRLHSLREVESVDSMVESGWWGGGGGGKEEEGTPAALVIGLREDGQSKQLKLEACSPAERDSWVSALGEAVRRVRGPRLADEVEKDRWRRKEKAESDAKRLQNAQRRREHEDFRARMAEKYGLDPGKYASRGGGGGGGDGGGGTGEGRSVAGASSRRIRPLAPQQQQEQQQHSRGARNRDGGGGGSRNLIGFEGVGAGGMLGGEVSRFQALAAAAAR